VTRGRPPQAALDEALPIAQVRGKFLQFSDGQPPFAYDFFFMSGERICLVWVKRTRRIWCRPEELEYQCAEAIAQYRELPAPAGITREIWYWSPYGNFRFFRIGDDGLIEIDRNGRDLARGPRKPGAKRKTVKKELRPRTDEPEKVSAENIAGESAEISVKKSAEISVEVSMEKSAEKFFEAQEQLAEKNPAPAGNSGDPAMAGQSSPGTATGHPPDAPDSTP
jgi:hypothetical protein